MELKTKGVLFGKIITNYSRRFKQSIVFQTESEVVYDWMEIQPWKAGSELPRIITITVNGKPLMHKGGNKLWFA